MSQDSEKVKRLVAFKERLQKRIEDLDTELKDTQAMLETVNSMLLEKGFKRVAITGESDAAEAPQPKEEIAAPEPGPSAFESSSLSENVIQLKTVTGELLAILHSTENSLRVLPAEDKNFNFNTPPFTQFLVERVLAKMQERDSELVRAGQLSADDIFSYNIVREGDVIHEIIVKNVDPERLRELKSSIRWTLEKMYEKTKSQG
jgi:hypothetical protein